MKRRDFIKTSALLAVAAGSGELMKAGAMPAEGMYTGPSEAAGPETDACPEAEAVPDPFEPEEPAAERLIVSAPMLQNFAETSIGVAFAVSALANGYVLVGESPDLTDARKVLCGGYRVTDIDDRVVRVRITGLKPSTRYYYRIGADRISYEGGYRMKILGTEEDPRTYSFTTAGAGTDGGFCVINDTHARWEPFGLAIEKIAALSPACVIWNGDASNVEETVEAQIRIFLNPAVGRKDYASGIPYLFSPGNHDSRGMANRHLERVWMFRQPEERLPRDWDLGRNFAVRLGDMALIGLDTAEDKLDTNPIFAGLLPAARTVRRRSNGFATLSRARRYAPLLSWSLSAIYLFSTTFQATIRETWPRTTKIRSTARTMHTGSAPAPGCGPRCWKKPAARWL